MGVAAAVTGAVVAAAGTTYGIVHGQQQEADAQEQARKADAIQKAQQGQIKDKQAQEENDLASRASQTASLTRQRQAQSGALSPSTLLTGPMGLSDTATGGGGKTLLGM